MKLVQGSIVLVPFPFTDLSSKKTRPALVVSKEVHGQDLILVAISSHKSKRDLEINDLDLAEGFLPLKSYVKYSKIVTLDKTIIKKVVARLGISKISLILHKVKALF